MSDNLDPRAAIIIALFDKLTLPKILLALFAGVCSVAVWSFAESRAAVFSRIVDSPAALLSVGVGFALLLVASIAWLFVAALERKTEMHIAELRERIADQEREIRALRDANRELSAQLAALAGSALRDFRGEHGQE